MVTNEMEMSDDENKIQAREPWFAKRNNRGEERAWKEGDEWKDGKEKELSRKKEMRRGVRGGKEEEEAGESQRDF